jgi:integrase
MGVQVREKPKGSGVWWIFICHNYKRKSKKIGRDKTKALKAAKKIEAKLNLGDLGVIEKKEPIPIFGQYSKLWLEDYIKSTKRVTTYQRYNSMLNLHVIPKIGKITLDELKRSHIRNVLLGIYKKGLSKSTVSTARNVISGVLEYGIEEEIIRHNVSRGIIKRLGLDERTDREIVRPFTPDEVDLFLSTCLKYESKWYPFFLCAFRTGMRLGELLGLQWGDLDWNSNFIQVERSFRHGRVTKTKTSKARRVDMSDQLRAELWRLYTQRKEEGLKEGRGEPIAIIFHTDGHYTAQNSIRNVWKRILTKAKMSHRRIHDTRHTFASLLLSNGETPVYVKEQLGHSSIQMTVDIYGHLIPSSNRDAVNRLDTITTDGVKQGSNGA